MTSPVPLILIISITCFELVCESNIEVMKPYYDVDLFSILRFIWFILF